MDLEIKATLKLEGLGPLANAILALAAAYSGSTAVIEKARTSSKAAKPVEMQAAPKPVDTPTVGETAAIETSQAPAVQEPAAASPSRPAINEQTIRALAFAKRDEGKSSAALIKNFGGSISSCPAERYEELYAALEAL